MRFETEAEVLRRAGRSAEACDAAEAALDLFERMGDDRVVAGRARAFAWHDPSAAP